MTWHLIPVVVLTIICIAQQRWLSWYNRALTDSFKREERYKEMWGELAAIVQWYQDVRVPELKAQRIPLPKSERPN